jgi:hypothetical protein
MCISSVPRQNSTFPVLNLELFIPFSPKFVETEQKKFFLMEKEGNLVEKEKEQDMERGKEGRILC